MPAELPLTGAVRVMGILNVTPDSFSDGGRFDRVEAALVHARRMADEGADWIDVGGESTRPGAQAVDEQQELDRVIPVIERLRREIEIPVSIDTSKPAVMQAAVAAGAAMINDVAALRQPGALKMAASLHVPVCLMHMQGEPRTMQASPEYENVVTDVMAFLRERIEAAEAAGINRDRVLIDPGFGFGKTLAHNYELLGGLQAFAALGCPLLVGISRKSMIGNLLDVGVDERLPGSLAAAVIAVMKGAAYVRVHDVRETVQAMKVVTACQNPELIV